LLQLESLEVEARLRKHPEVLPSAFASINLCALQASATPPPLLLDGPSLPSAASASSASSAAARRSRIAALEKANREALVEEEARCRLALEKQLRHERAIAYHKAMLAELDTEVGRVQERQQVCFFFCCLSLLLAGLLLILYVSCYSYWLERQAGSALTMPKRSAPARFASLLRRENIPIAQQSVSCRQSMLQTWKPSGALNTTWTWQLVSLAGIIRRNARYCHLHLCRQGKKIA
jgi:hypothetical protein